MKRDPNVMGTSGENPVLSSRRVTTLGPQAKDRCRPALTRILVPLDFSLSSRSVLAYAANLVEPSEASITLLHVVQPLITEADYGYGPVTRKTPNEGEIKKARTKLRAMRKTKLGGIGNVSIIVRTGIPHDEIVRAAREQNIALIVMGVHSRPTCNHQTIGSTSENVVRQAPCPVLMVRNHLQTFGGKHQSLSSTNMGLPLTLTLSPSDGERGHSARSSVAKSKHQPSTRPEANEL